MTDLKNHPTYWDLHKKIYCDELDTLDHEIRDIIMTQPNDSTTIRFNCNIDRLVMEQIKESDSQAE